MMSTLLNSAVFPGSQGGPLEHIIAAKAVAFGEALEDDFFNGPKYIIYKSTPNILSDALEEHKGDIEFDL